MKEQSPMLLARQALASSSVVLLANDVNQSIFSLAWLLKMNVMSEDELNPNSAVCVPGLTSVKAPTFEFMVLPDRVQLHIPGSVPDATSLISQKLEAIVRTLPHTPFSAVGINYHYKFQHIPAAEFAVWNKTHFASPWALRHIGQHPRDRFGTTFAYNCFEGARMRVRAAVSAKDLKASMLSVEEPAYVVDVHCNLHREILAEQGDAVRNVIRHLSMWNNGLSETNSIIASLF